MKAHRIRLDAWDVVDYIPCSLVSPVLFFSVLQTGKPERLRGTSRDFGLSPNVLRNACNVRISTCVLKIERKEGEWEKRGWWRWIKREREKNRVDSRRVARSTPFSDRISVELEGGVCSCSTFDSLFRACVSVCVLHYCGVAGCRVISWSSVSLPSSFTTKSVNWLRLFLIDLTTGRIATNEIG